MDSRTISPGLRPPTSAGGECGAPGLPEEAEDEDAAEPVGVTYLVVFAIVAIVTALAFVPVWLLLLGQRAVEFLNELFNPRN